MLRRHNGPATETDCACLTVAELANAARSGPVGPATVLAYVVRLQKHLVQLAKSEEAADEMANDALAEHRAREEAIRAGTVIAFPARRRMHIGHGGHAA